MLSNLKRINSLLLCISYLSISLIFVFRLHSNSFLLLQFLFLRLVGISFIEFHCLLVLDSDSSCCRSCITQQLQVSSSWCSTSGGQSKVRALVDWYLRVLDQRQVLWLNVVFVNRLRWSRIQYPLLLPVSLGHKAFDY